MEIVAVAVLAVLSCAIALVLRRGHERRENAAAAAAFARRAVISGVGAERGRDDASREHSRPPDVLPL